MNILYLIKNYRKDTSVFMMVCVLCFCLTACGFSPLYGTGKTIQGQKGIERFDQISIENIPDREGQYLRNALMDRFYQKGYPQHSFYRLKIEPIKQTLTNLDITKSSDATRAQLRVNTVISLYNQDTGQELLTRKLTSITSYNVLQSQFTTRVSEENARKNALDDLARQIEQQLILYFKRL